MSLAPSPMATVCSRRQLYTCAMSFRTWALRSPSTIVPLHAAGQLAVLDLELVGEREVEAEAPLQLVDEQREAAAHEADLEAEAVQRPARSDRRPGVSSDLVESAD